MGNSLSDSKDLLIPFFGKFTLYSVEVSQSPVFKYDSSAVGIAAAAQ